METKTWIVTVSRNGKHVKEQVQAETYWFDHNFVVFGTPGADYKAADVVAVYAPEQLSAFAVESELTAYWS